MLTDVFSKHFQLDIPILWIDSTCEDHRRDEIILNQWVQNRTIKKTRSNKFIVYFLQTVLLVLVPVLVV